MNIAVVGAGIVGLCCASYLQRDDHTVTIFDPISPGGGCSSGNSGLIAPGYCIPLAVPGIVSKVPSWLLDPRGPLRIDWTYLPKALPWLLKFLSASREKKFLAAAVGLRALHEKTFDNYAPLVTAAGAEHLIRRTGELSVYESERDFADDHYALGIQRNLGVKMEILSGDEARAIEPNLSGSIMRAVLFPDAGHCRNPEQIVLALAHALVANGGALRRERVFDFVIDAGQVRAVRTETGAATVDCIVIAAGSLSGQLTRRLGDHIPIETLRGYHAVFRDPGIEPKIAVHSAAGKFTATPMEMGLRCGGSIEIAGHTRRPDYRRAETIANQAKKLYPTINAGSIGYWMGHRPAMPDSLPVIDRASRIRNAFYAFGHGSSGLMGASTTGRLIADLVSGRTPAIDVLPFRATRFA
jgi:D-amino-acid dehydrogenase